MEQECGGSSTNTETILFVEQNIKTECESKEINNVECTMSEARYSTKEEKPNDDILSFVNISNQVYENPLTNTREQYNYIKEENMDTEEYIITEASTWETKSATAA